MPRTDVDLIVFIFLYPQNCHSAVGVMASGVKYPDYGRLQTPRPSRLLTSRCVHEGTITH